MNIRLAHENETDTIIATIVEKTVTVLSNNKNSDMVINTIKTGLTNLLRETFMKKYSPQNQGILLVAVADDDALLAFQGLQSRPGGKPWIATPLFKLPECTEEAANQLQKRICGSLFASTSINTHVLEQDTEEQKQLLQNGWYDTGATAPLLPEKDKNPTAGEQTLKLKIFHKPARENFFFENDMEWEDMYGGNHED